MATKSETQSITKLSESNYQSWKFDIELYLTANDMMGIVDGTVTRPTSNTNQEQDKWDKLHNTAKYVIGSSISQTQKAIVYNCATANEMWIKLREAFDDQSAEMKQSTWEDFYSYKIKSDQSVVEGILKIKQIASSLTQAGATITDEALIQKVLSALDSEKYRMFRTSWRQTPTAQQTPANLLARLKVEEREMEALAPKKELFKARAYVTQPTDEKEARKKSIAQLKKTTKCHNCNKLGHWAKECRGPKKNKNQRPSNTNQNEDKPSSNIARAFAVTFDQPSDENELWYRDSGSSEHLCGDKSWFIELNYFDDPLEISMADQSTTRGLGIGMVKVRSCSNGKWTDCTINDVIYSPGSKNLFSEGVLKKKGYDFKSNTEGVKYWRRKDGADGPEAIFNNSMFIMKFKRPITKSYAAVCKVNKAQLWHSRLGHFNMEIVKRTIKAVDGINDIDVNEDFYCDDCALGKMARQPYPRSEKHDIITGQVIHVDLSGKITPTSLGKSNYFMLAVDKKTGFTMSYFLKQKSQAADAVINFIKFIEKQTGNHVKTLRSDNGGEFVCSELSTYLDKKGIVHGLSAPYSPEQNGVIERAMRTIGESMRTMMAAYSLNETHPFLWSEAVSTACFLYNRVVNCRNDKTPYEQIFGHKPNLAHLAIFGCPAFAHVPNQLRTKLEAKAVQGIFVGYEGTSRNYRIYDPKEKCIINERNVSFNEKLPEVSMKVTSKLFEEVPRVNQPPAAPKSTTSSPPSSSSSDDDSTSNSSTETVVENETQNEEQLQFKVTAGEQVFNIRAPKNKASTVEIPGQNVQLTVNPVPPPPPLPRRRATEKEKERTQPTRNTKPIERLGIQSNVQSNAAKVNTAIPRTYKQAMKSVEAFEWAAAVKEELKSHEVNQTWTIVEKPQTSHVIGSRWVFVKKKNLDGSIQRYKARLVALGCYQLEGIEYTDTFSSVCRSESVRLFFAIAASENLKIVQLDIKTAFLHASLKETIYMSIPEGLHETIDKNLVCKLNKSLYGLKQAPRYFSETFTNHLIIIGLKQLRSDSCAFVGMINDVKVYMLCYVDDCLIMSSQMDKIMMVVKHVGSKFEITTCKPEKFVGFEINMTDEYIILTQTSYILSMIERFDMENCRTASVPMQNGTQLDFIDDCQADLPFQHIIGSLIYTANGVRPDVAYAVSRLSRHMAKYSKQHLDAAKYVLKYLMTTNELGISFKVNEPLNLHGFTDADYAGDASNRKSTSGVVFMAAKGPISWQSIQQAVVSLSSTESELNSLTSGSTQTVWLRKFFDELGFKQERPTVIFCDNTSTIKLCHNDEFHKRTKHIQTKFYYVRDQIKNNEVEVKYVPTAEQLADILTKPLMKQKHEQNKIKLGMRKKPESVSEGAKAFNTKRNAFPLILTTLMISCMLSPAVTMLIQNARPVIWRNTNVPVASGYQDVQIAIQLENPCAIFNLNTTHELVVKSSLRNCNKIYNQLIIDKLESMCDTEHPSDSLNTRNKRILPAMLGTLVIAAIAFVGVSVTADISAHNQISELRSIGQMQATKIENMQSRIDLHGLATKDLRQSVEQIATDLYLHEQNYNTYVSKMTDTSFAISFIISQLVIGNKALKETERQWKNQKLAPEFLEFFKITLPCSDLCPVQLAYAKGKCQFDKANNRVSIRFNTPYVDHTRHLLKADPFVMLRTATDRTCRIKYTGPTQAIVANNSNCVQPLMFDYQSKSDIVLEHDGQCVSERKFSNTTRYFQVDGNCEPTKSSDHLDYVQIKYLNGANHVYCAYSNITIDGQTDICPNLPFLVPASTSFLINGHRYTARTIDIEDTFKLDPSLSFKINNQLRPTLNLDNIKTQLENVDKLLEQSKRSHITNTVLVYSSIIGGATTIFIILICFFILRKYFITKNTVKISAKRVRFDESVENPIELDAIPVTSD